LLQCFSSFPCPFHSASFTAAENFSVLDHPAQTRRPERIHPNKSASRAHLAESIKTSQAAGEAHPSAEFAVEAGAS
jgi:hypothetical protein